MTDLEKLVAQMRECQKKYFTDRDYFTLKEAKRLEKLVDKYLDSIKPKIIDDDTPYLFDGDVK